MSAPLRNRDRLATRLIHAGQSPDPLTGAVMCPTDCALLLRSLKTLSVRVDRQAANPALLAQHLEANAQALASARSSIRALPRTPAMPSRPARWRISAP